MTMTPEVERLRSELEQFVNFAGEQANRVRELEAELAGLRERAAEVEKYWRDWPSERRAKVHALSRFLAGAIEDLAVTVESWRAAPSGWPCKCGTDETDMVHTAERCYSTTEPVAAPVSVGVPCFIISGPMLDDDPVRWLRCSRDKGHPGEHSHIEDLQDEEITWGWLHSLESPYRADYVDGRNNPHRPREIDDPTDDIDAQLVTAVAGALRNKCGCVTQDGKHEADANLALVAMLRMLAEEATCNPADFKEHGMDAACDRCKALGRFGNIEVSR